VHPEPTVAREPSSKAHGFVPSRMRTTIPYVDDFIHLDSAAGSLADQSVHDAILAHLDLEGRRGNTEARRAVADRIDEIYDDLSELVRVPREGLSISESHTAAWQRAFQAVSLEEGDRVLVGRTEWGGNLSAIWQRCRSTGAEMEIIPSDPSGAIDATALARMLDHRVRVVCATWVPAVTGIVNAVEQVAMALKDHPAWLFVDAAQAFGNVATDLSHARLDVVTVSARKYLRAPRGTGFAVYSRRFLSNVEPLGMDQFSGPWQADEGPDPISGARRFEFIETSFAVRLGLAAAVKFALARDLEADMTTIQAMAAELRAALADLPDVTVQDHGDSLSGIVTFSHDTFTPVQIKAALGAVRINIGAPQHSYGPLWYASDHPAVARLSPHAFNTHAELERAVKTIANLK